MGKGNALWRRGHSRIVRSRKGMRGSDFFSTGLCTGFLSPGCPDPLLLLVSLLFLLCFPGLLSHVFLFFCFLSFFSFFWPFLLSRPFFWLFFLPVFFCPGVGAGCLFAGILPTIFCAFSHGPAGSSPRIPSPGLQGMSPVG